MNNLLDFIKVSIVYFLGFVMSKLISFFLLPFYTRFIETADMGYFSYTQTTLNVIIPVTCVQIWAVILRFMYDGAELEYKYKVIANGVYISIFSTIVYSTVMFFWFYYSNIPYKAYVYIFGFSTLLHYIYGNIARGLGRNRLYAVTGVIISFVVAISSIVLILVFKMGLKALYLSNIIAAITQVVIIEYNIKLFHCFKRNHIDFSFIKSMLKFALPLSINEVVYWFLTGYNIIVITQYLGLVANGVYSIATRFSVALLLVSNCFILAWQELAYTSHNNSNRCLIYNYMLNYGAQLLLVCLILLLPLINITFKYLVAPNYHASFKFIPLSLLSTCGTIYAAFLADIFNAEKKNKTIMYSTIIAVIINTASLHLLIDKIGIQAANISLCAGILICIIIRSIILKKYFHEFKIKIKILLCYSMLFTISHEVFFLDTKINMAYLFISSVILVYINKKLICKILRHLRTKRNDCVRTKS